MLYKARRILEGSGLPTLLERLPTWRGLLVLNYHRIGDAADTSLDPGLFSATVEGFREQVRYLKSRRWLRIVTPADLHSLRSETRRRSVMLTFDDGYRDNHELAGRVLREEGVPATFFISTGFIDHPRLPWWDEIAHRLRTSPRSVLEPTRWWSVPLPLSEATFEHNLRTLLGVYKRTPAHQLPSYLADLFAALGGEPPPEDLVTDLWMTWDMIRELRDDGHIIGGHTVNHPVLANLMPDQQHREVGECARRLTEELGMAPRTFSYPVGNATTFDEITRACLKDHGFELSFTYHGGVCDPSQLDPLAIPRMAIEAEDTFDKFRSHVALPRLYVR